MFRSKMDGSRAGETAAARSPPCTVADRWGTWFNADITAFEFVQTAAAAVTPTEEHQRPRPRKQFLFFNCGTSGNGLDLVVQPEANEELISEEFSFVADSHADTPEGYIHVSALPLLLDNLMDTHTVCICTPTASQLGECEITINKQWAWTAGSSPIAKQFSVAAAGVFGQLLCQPAPRGRSA